MIALSAPFAAGVIKVTVGGVVSNAVFSMMLAVAGWLTLPARSLTQSRTVFVPVPGLSWKIVGFADSHWLEFSFGVACVSLNSQWAVSVAAPITTLITAESVTLPIVSVGVAI